MQRGTFGAVRLGAELRKALALLLLLGLYCFSSQGTLSLYAQEEEDGEEYSPPSEGIPTESDWDGYISDLYSKGDQTFTISVGVNFPTVFFSNGEKIDHNFSPPIGGMGSLAFSYFLNSNFFLGGEITGMFNPTIGKNTVFIIPIGVRAGGQFVIGRFEFPMQAAVGLAIHRYLKYGHFGMYLKGTIGAFYRFNPDWSFGINADWGWYPEWASNPQDNVDANIIGVTLSARYHF